MDNLKNFFTIPKIIFMILGIIVLIEVIFVVRSLVAPTAPPLQLENLVSTKTVAKISLTVLKTSFRIEEVVPVAVVVDTGEKAVSGADLIVKFDPDILEVSSESIVRGKIFDEYPLISVDTKKGLVAISGVSSLNKIFKGTGQFALINFKAKIPGKTFLTIDFKKGSTTASNLVDAGTSQNVLDNVDNLELTIK